ncbi:hypothetical protein V8F33_013699 [Rhypophila sp. PSN 637]
MSLLQRQNKWVKQEQDLLSLTPIICTSGVSSTLSSEDTKHPPPRLSPGGLQTFPHVAAHVPRSALIPPGSSHVRSIKTEPLAPFYSPPEDDNRISSVLPPSVLEFVSSETTKSESQFPRSLPVSQIKREPVYDHRKPTEPTRRSRGRPRLSAEHRKPPYKSTGPSTSRQDGLVDVLELATRAGWVCEGAIVRISRWLARWIVGDCLSLISVRNAASGTRQYWRIPTDEARDPDIPPYAILSHTWGDEEVLFKDLEDGTAKNKGGYAKIRFCGDQAERDGAELQHALNSMFDWYRRAAKCYVYLADVSTHQQDIDSPNWKLVVRHSGCVTRRWAFQELKTPAIANFFCKGWKQAFRQSRWFTRGWTLQELIAPATVEFFSKEGLYLGDKKSLKQEIHNITGIPLRALQGYPLSDFSFDERKGWTERRNTTLEEDKAYSLFDILDVHMPVLYGEGTQKAFKRLQEKVHENYLCLAKLWSTEPRDPRVEKKRIELAKRGLLVDAYHWVFDNPDFNRWRQLSESRLLWIKGDPGKGKTMLLCGIINELERPITINGGNLAYFFCQATDSRINNATSVL